MSISRVKKNKTMRDKLELNLDNIVRTLCFTIHGKQCYTCGLTENIECGHLITRSRRTVRWDLSNLRPQCTICNNRHEVNPEIYTNMWIQENGLKEYDRLVKDSWSSKKFTLIELEEMLSKYKGMLIDLECRGAGFNVL